MIEQERGARLKLRAQIGEALANERNELVEIVGHAGGLWWVTTNVITGRCPGFLDRHVGAPLGNHARTDGGLGGLPVPRRW
jgi:hypothetical protein